MHAWYGLEKVFPITRISPKSGSDWAKAMIWPCGFVFWNVTQCYHVFPDVSRKRSAFIYKGQGIRQEKDTGTHHRRPERRQHHHQNIKSGNFWFALSRQFGLPSSVTANLSGFFLSSRNDTSLGPPRVVVSLECGWNSLQNSQICFLDTVFLLVGNVNNFPVLCLQKKGYCIRHVYTTRQSEGAGWDGWTDRPLSIT